MGAITRRIAYAAVWVAAAGIGAQHAAGQSGGYVVTLGTDTVHIERFNRSDRRIEGHILTRIPVTRQVRYSLTLAADGRPLRYEMQMLDADGTPLRTLATSGSLTWVPDGVIRRLWTGDAMDSVHIASPAPPLPAPVAPFTGTSMLMYELAFAQARRRAATRQDTAVYLIAMVPPAQRVERRRVWLVGPDSAEMDYFGVARSGYRFDGSGRLLGADWTATTYGYLIRRTEAPDIERLALTWASAERRGQALGALSPRDTARATLGEASLTIDYSRPSRRGRTIWGGVVPWDRVWRLGADFATHLHTSASIALGHRTVPAGSWTLWMQPSREGTSWLIVNSLTRVFGTNYDPARDFLRVPLTRVPLEEPVERLTLAVEDGRFWIRWGDSGWWAPAAARAEPWPERVDSALAARWFAEADSLCRLEAGRLWGTSLCGPIVVADAITRTRATSAPEPAAPPPPALGFANAAFPWGDTRWTTIVWRIVPRDPQLRARLLIHELFHRVQPDLGLFVNDSTAGHLDTVDGRYWIQLEWRALARALTSSGERRDAAVRDALAFRAERFRLFPGAATAEHAFETNEGLAQYTGTVVAMRNTAEAIADAVTQLEQAPVYNETLVRSFPYPAGPAWGLLLDAYAPGWTRRFRANADFGELVMAASGLQPAASPDSAALRYRGAELRAAEEQREQARQQRLAELRRLFVDGPVIVFPNGTSNSFTTSGMMTIPGHGTVYPTFRSQGEWGSVAADLILMSDDRSHLVLPAPASTQGRVLTGEGWTLNLADGWVVRPGSRPGDLQVVRQ